MPNTPASINVKASRTAQHRGRKRPHQQSRHQPPRQPSTSLSLKPSDPLKKRFLRSWDIPSSSKTPKIAPDSSPSTSHHPIGQLRRHPRLLLTDDTGNFIPNPLSLPSSVPKPSPLAIPSWIRDIGDPSTPHAPSNPQIHSLPCASGSSHVNTRISNVEDTGVSTFVSNCRLTSRALDSKLMKLSGPSDCEKTALTRSAPFLSDCDFSCAPAGPRTTTGGTSRRDQRLSQSLERPSWPEGESSDRALQHPPMVQRSRTVPPHPTANEQRVGQSISAPKPSASTGNPSSSYIGKRLTRASAMRPCLLGSGLVAKPLFKHPNGEVVSVIYKPGNLPKLLHRDETERGDLELMDVTGASPAFPATRVNRSRPMNSRNPTSIPQRPRETIRPANTPRTPEEEDVATPASSSRAIPQMPVSQQMASHPPLPHQPRVLSPSNLQPTTPRPSTCRPHALSPAYLNPSTPMPPACPQPSTPMPPAYPQPSTPLSPAYPQPSTPMSPACQHPTTPLSPAYLHPSTSPSPTCRSPVLSPAACMRSNSPHGPASPLPNFSPLPPACPMPPASAPFRASPSASPSHASTSLAGPASDTLHAPARPPSSVPTLATARSIAPITSLAPTTPHRPSSRSPAGEQNSRSSSEKVIKVGRRAGTVHYWRSSLQMPKGNGTMKGFTKKGPISKSWQPSKRAPEPSCRSAVPIAPAPIFPLNHISQKVGEASGTRPAGVGTDSVLASQISLIYRNHRFWRLATKLPSMTPEEALARRIACKIPVDSRHDETGVSETRANEEEATAASQVGGHSGSTSAGIDEQEDDMSFPPEMTLDEEQHEIRRLHVTKEYELKKLERDAESKYRVKMNLRGRQKLENWLASGDLVALSSVKYLVLTLNLDRRLVSEEVKERQDALEDLDNRMLRKLEALKIRTSTRDGRTNWSLLTASFIGDEDQDD